jgi:hypothetical protein
MDPYIEQRGLFEDFHNHLIGEIHRALAALVPDRYVVRTGERPYVVLADRDGKEEYVFVPDVGLIATGPIGQQGVVSVAEPKLDSDAISMQAFVSSEYRESFVEIYVTEPERLLVTCIEILSPSNKRYGSVGWNVYARKRQGLLLGTANFIELDLLRRGDKMPMLNPWPNSPYTLLVSRKEHAPHCRVWPGHYRRPLPQIPVPLCAPDPDVQLDLQPMIDAIYARSRYQRDIDYTQPLTPPLTADDAGSPSNCAPRDIYSVNRYTANDASQCSPT